MTRIRNGMHQVAQCYLASVAHDRRGGRKGDDRDGEPGVSRLRCPRYRAVEGRWTMSDDRRAWDTADQSNFQWEPHTVRCAENNMPIDTGLCGALRRNRRWGEGLIYKWWNSITVASTYRSKYKISESWIRRHTTSISLAANFPYRYHSYATL
jgi:hypothetical protein